MMPLSTSSGAEYSVCAPSLRLLGTS
jgi:hypothetical protein